MGVFKISLAAARVNAELSQAKAAEMLGISRTVLIALEKGRRKPKPMELMAFSKIYSIPVERISIPEQLTKS